MPSVSYLLFYALLTRHFLLSAIKSKSGVTPFHKLTEICLLARDCVTQVNKVNIENSFIPGTEIDTEGVL